MKSYLKVKVVSLAAEMTYIRRQELKWKNKARYARQKQKQDAVKYAEQNFWTLNSHRYDLKYQARNAHLAYGALKGVRYAEMEPICYGVFKGYGSIEPAWGKIEDMVARFSKDEPNPQEAMQRFAEWLSYAKAWYEGNKERIPAVKERLAAERLARANDQEYQDRKLKRALSWRKWSEQVNKPD